MKQTTYTLSLGGNDSGDSKVSKMEKSLKNIWRDRRAVTAFWEEEY